MRLSLLTIKDIGSQKRQNVIRIWMLEFDFPNLALNVSSRSEKEIVFLYFSDEIVVDWGRSENLNILVCFQGFTQNGNRK